VFALGHTMLVIAWHLLSNDSTYEDLGGDYFARRNDAEARKRYLIRQLEALGQHVTVESAA
jgi:transposase